MAQPQKCSGKTLWTATWHCPDFSHCWKHFNISRELLDFLQLNTYTLWSEEPYYAALIMFATGFCNMHSVHTANPQQRQLISSFTYTALQNTLKHNTTNITQRSKRFQLYSARTKPRRISPLTSKSSTSMHYHALKHHIPRIWATISTQTSSALETPPKAYSWHVSLANTTYSTCRAFTSCDLEVVAFDDRCHFRFWCERKVCFS